MRPHLEFITLIEKNSVTRSSHVRASTDRLVATCTQEKIESRLKCCAGAFFIQKEWILCEREEIRDFLELRAAHAARVAKIALSRHSEAENHTRLFTV